MTEPTHEIITKPWEALPAGEYAVVELMGHTTLVGRIQEVERFGAKLMAMQPLFAGKLLDPIYQGGASIYRISPCSAEVAWKEQPTDTWQLPEVLRALVPPAALPAPTAAPGLSDPDFDPDPDAEDDDDPDNDLGPVDNDHDDGAL